MLAARGAVRIDADQLAREVVAPGTAGHAAVVARFGSTVLAADGSLDRAALGRVVFADTEARRDLEEITHPLIREAMAARIGAALAAAPPLVVVEVPLLFESGLDQVFPASLLVAAPADLRRARIMTRDGLTADEAEARMASQMPEADKRGLATWVLENAGDRAALDDEVTRLWPMIVGT